MRSPDELICRLTEEIAAHGVCAFPEFARGQRAVPDVPAFVTAAVSECGSGPAAVRLNGARETELMLVLRVKLHGCAERNPDILEHIWYDAVLPAVGSLRLAVRKISRSAVWYEAETGTFVQTAEITVCAAQTEAEGGG